MIETSKDLLFIVLAFCILWLTIFLSWLLYYVISIIRDAEAVVRQVKAAVEKIDDLTRGVKARFDKSAASFTLVAQAVKELVVWFIEERSVKRTTRRRRTSKK